jgi:hypothetical protein
MGGEDETIRVVDPAGPGRPITSVECSCLAVLSWAPDGRLVVVEYDDDLEPVWTLLSPESGERITLAGPAETWSPDGQRFAFVRPAPSGDVHELVVADLATGELRTLVQVAGEGSPDWTPHWSPTGGRRSPIRAGRPRQTRTRCTQSML